MAQSNNEAALKITISESGIYRITYAELINAGFDPNSADARHLKVENLGKEVPIYVEGEQDGVFHATDQILFYATAINTPYTNKNVYWLSIGESAGKRMGTQSGAVTGSATVQTRFLATHYAEENTTYWHNMPTKNEERWFWGQRLSPDTAGMSSSRTYTLDLPHVAPEGTAAVRVQLKGYTSLNHRTRIYINGNPVDDQNWQGQVPFSHTAEVSQMLLQTGANEITVEAIHAGAIIDQVLVNWIEVSYWQTYDVVNDQLLFGSPTAGRHQFSVSGLSSSELLLLNVTDPSNPIHITNYSTAAAADGYTARFEGEVGLHNRYFVTTFAQLKSAAKLELVHPPIWRSSNQGADYIIITHESFLESAQRLAAHREKSGLRVVVVQPEELYNEFSFGLFDPTAIRDFLHFTFYYWQVPTPAYVVLLGDANQDYKDNLKQSVPNYVPSYNLSSNLFGEISSDNWFADILGDDGLPDMHIGRLAASDPQEAAIIVDKIIRYEESPLNAPWKNSHLFVAGAESIFEPIAERILAEQPSLSAARRIYANHYAASSPKADIIQAINQGSGFVTYVGHGNHENWGFGNSDSGYIFGTSDIGLLTNVDQPAIMIMGNCLNGFFAGTADEPSLAEELQRASSGGAVAVWAPSGLGYPTDHERLLQAFYGALRTPDVDTLGEAVTAAKRNFFSHGASNPNVFNRGQSSRELIDTYILFGDPAMKIPKLSQ